MHPLNIFPQMTTVIELRSAICSETTWENKLALAPLAITNDYIKEGVD